jgi:pilus assembly protein Flp/PilA
MMNSIKRFMREEEGVTMVEYGLLAALIAVVCIGAIQVIGTQLNIVFGIIGTALDAVTP